MLHFGSVRVQEQNSIPALYIHDIPYKPPSIPATHCLTVITVLQYGYAFHASSCISSEPLGANHCIKLGTLLWRVGNAVG